MELVFEVLRYGGSEFLGIGRSKDGEPIERAYMGKLDIEGHSRSLACGWLFEVYSDSIVILSLALVVAKGIS